ncbi:MAG: hypothetical protein NC936_00320 [Candidatus Omnitrophica bacterium]|nr:hypothetical protein [Candidatus Omnitrophota bacterium]
MSLSYTDSVAYPFGLNVFRSKYIPYIYVFYYSFLSIITSPVVAYNIQMILNILLSGIFMYLLVSYLLLDNPLLALFSGMIFAFCPYQFARIWQHPGLTYNQWFPLVLFSVLLLKEKTEKSKIIFFMFSLLFLYSFDLHISFFGSFVLILFLIYSSIYDWRKKALKENIRFYKTVVISWSIVLLLLFFQHCPLIKNSFLFSSTTAPSAFNPYHRPFEDLFQQSARPLSYFLPAAVHPIFGKFTEQFIGSQLYGISLTEHALYLGWIPLILAFVAFRRWRRARKLKINEKENFYIGFFIFLAAVAWLFSQPPWWKIGPLKILMPSFFMYKILPMVRAYCRFGIVVMLAIAVLAGYGLKFILEKHKSRIKRIVIPCLFSSLVLFEFWNWPPFKVIDVSRVPQVYYWLKEKPGDFAIAEYPLDADSPNEMYKFYQTKHEKKIINGSIPGTPANNLAKTITKLSELYTTKILKWMGVKYVLVHHDGYLQTELTEDREELKKISINKGLKFVISFTAEECPQKDIMCTKKSGPIDVYEIVSGPIKPEVKD